MRYSVRFTHDPAAPVLTAEAREAVRRQLAEATRHDLQEELCVTDIIDRARDELLALYRGRGYRGPRPPLDW